MRPACSCVMRERTEAPAHARAHEHSSLSCLQGGQPGCGPGGSVSQMLQTVGLFSDMLPTCVRACVRLHKPVSEWLFDIAADYNN